MIILLFIKWKWITIKVFILIISHWVGWGGGARGWVGLAVSGVAEVEEVEEVEGEAGEADTLGVTLWKHIVISVWLSCSFISIEMFLYGTDLSFTICCNFSAWSEKGPYCKRSQKQLWILPDCFNVNFLSGTASTTCFFSLSHTGLEALISTKSSFVNSYNVGLISSWTF